MFDVQVPEFMAGVKAIALISRLITVTLRSLLEDRTIHVFNINIHYLQLVIFLFFGNNGCYIALISRLH